MKSDAQYFLNNLLGSNFIEDLQKTEIYKAGTRTVVDTSDMHLGLKLVPRAVMSFLTKNLSSMQIGETKEVILPVKGNRPTMRVTKHERDCFSGEIEDSTEKYTDRKIAEFKYRSIPGVGLVVMSAFELYDIEDLEKEPKQKIPDPTLEMVQRMIDDCLMMHELIDKVKDKKISERDAIQQLMLAKLGESVIQRSAPLTDSTREKQAEDIASVTKIATEEPQAKKDEYFRGMANGLQVANSIINEKEPKFIDAPGKKKKISPLKGFLEGREKKLKKNEFKIELMKGEQISCPDCGQNVFDGDAFSACVCYGDCGKVFLKKTEDGIKIRFSNNWDIDSIEMLLEVLRRKRG